MTVKATNSSGITLATGPAGTEATFNSGSAVALHCTSSGATGEAIVVANLDDSLASVRRSPLSYVLAAESSEDEVKLSGVCISSDGREWVIGSTVYHTLTLTTTKTTLGELLLGVAGSPVLPVDIAEFRGELHGGTAHVVPGYTRSNLAGSTVASSYALPVGAITLHPGPVILGGASVVWQPTRDFGFYDYPVTTGNPDDLNAGDSDTFDVRSPASTLTRLMVRFAFSSAPDTLLRIQAFYFELYNNDPQPTVSSVASVDQLFAPVEATGEEEGIYTALIELEQGNWRIVLSVPDSAGTASDIYYTVGRFD